VLVISSRPWENGPGQEGGRCGTVGVAREQQRPEPMATREVSVQEARCQARRGVGGKGMEKLTRQRGPGWLCNGVICPRLLLEPQLPTVQAVGNAPIATRIAYSISAPPVYSNKPSSGRCLACQRWRSTERSGGGNSKMCRSVAHAGSSRVRPQARRAVPGGSWWARARLNCRW